VFEVRSPTTRWGAVLAKAGEYLEAGVTLVCVLDDVSRSAHLYRSDQPAQVFQEGQELVLPEVLAGFAAVVGRFFE
jgi:Uma2 family endonuclease